MDNKKRNSVLMVFFIVAVMYMLLYLVIPFKKHGASWAAFTFGLVAIVVSCIATLYIFQKGDDLKSKVYGLPLLKLVYLYFCVQLLLSLVLIIIDAIVKIPAWLPVVLGVLALGLAAIGLIAADNVRDVIIEQEKKDAENIKQMLTFKLDASSLIDATNDPAVKKAAEKFAEKLRFSDPVSSEALAEIEERLSVKLETLTSTIGSMNQADAINQIDSLTLLLNERNRKCKAMKGMN